MTYIANQKQLDPTSRRRREKTTVSKFSTPGRTDGRTEGWILGESLGDGVPQDGESGNQSEAASSFIYPFSSEFGTFLTVVELYEGHLLLFHLARSLKHVGPEQSPPRNGGVE